MKHFLVAGYALIFAVSIWVGFSVSQQTIPLIPRETQAEPSFPVPGTIESSSMKLIVVSVKQLKYSHPDLQIIWMVAFNPETPIKLIPIYPTYDEPALDDELLDSFGLERDGRSFTLNEATSLILHERGLDWDGAIALDNRALAYLIDAFGPIKIEGKKLDRDELADYKFPDFSNKQLGLTFNTLMWREICWNILHSPENISSLNPQFEKHMRANFSDEVAGQDWITLLSSVIVPSCEFPMYFRTNP